MVEELLFEEEVWVDYATQSENIGLFDSQFNEIREGDIIRLRGGLEGVLLRDGYGENRSACRATSSA